MQTVLTEFFGVPSWIQHIFFELIAVVILIIIGFFVLRSPKSRFSLIFLSILDFWKGIASSLMPEEEVRKHLPFIFSVFIFILIMNLMGLIPGLMPPTMNINTNIGLAIFSFLYYNFWGFKSHGFGYIKHFLGPFLPIAVLYLPIELISHAFRIVSLSVRLAGNMTGDHTVLEIFTHLTYVIVPVAFFVLGTIVSVVQAFVFSILSLIYIALATGGEEH